MGEPPPPPDELIFRMAPNNRVITLCNLKLDISQTPLGTAQYLWEYGTSKFGTGPPVTFDLFLWLKGELHQNGTCPVRYQFCQQPTYYLEIWHITCYGI